MALTVLEWLKWLSDWVAHCVYDCGEVSLPNVQQIEQLLQQDSQITHIAMVHCETTTGILKPDRESREVSEAVSKMLYRGCNEQFCGIPWMLLSLTLIFISSE